MMEPAIIKGMGQDPPTARLYYGADVRETLRQLPDGCIQTVCTSPPFWSLRDYHTESSIWGGDADCDHEFEMQNSTHTRANPGGESDIGQRDRDFDTLREQQHGFCKKCGAWEGNLGLEPSHLMYVEHMVEIFEEVRRVLRDDGTAWLNLGDSYNANEKRKGPSTLKPKDLVGIPWRVAFALQAAGWWLRSDIVWSKFSCMPEPVQDRCTRSHEYIFLLTKSRYYFYDNIAIKEPSNSSDSLDRNKRTVWYVNPKPYPGAHFAVWPTKLVEPMILAGTSAKGACSKCGAPWSRVTKREQLKERDDVGRTHSLPEQRMGKNPPPERGWEVIYKTVGWEPTCKCSDTDASGRCIVLDPFAGTATTGKVALRHNRDFIGIDRNAEYRMMAQARILGYAAPSEDPDDTPSVLDLF